MKDNQQLSVHNVEFLETLYKEYLNNKNSVDNEWQNYFKSLDNDNETAFRKTESNISSFNLIAYNLLLNYRQYGHTAAKLDPLGKVSTEVSHKIEVFNKNALVDLSSFSCIDFFNMTLENFEILLKKIYSNSIGFEIEHLENLNEKNWLYNKIESEAWKISFDNDVRESFLTILQRTKLFESYIHTKFLGAKRFSIEGGESTILSLQELVKLCASNGVNEIVLGMAHRGRLSTLVQVLHKPHSSLFAGFMGYAPTSELPSFVGDVKYHLGYDHDVKVDGANVHISLAYNPSHLESVNSVVMGMTRAKQDSGNEVLPVLIHGDASFAGQGCVMETLAMSPISAYDVKGIVHIVINNQIGFTTNPEQHRGTRYCSDIAKGLNIPILHVNGNDPEAVVYAVQLAFEYRSKFKKDIVLDIFCYRKYGHNEGDEPLFTQPSLYTKIQSKDFKDCVDLYYERLKSEGLAKDFETLGQDYINFMNDEFEIAKKIYTGEIPYESHEESTVFKKHVEFEKSLYSKYDGKHDIGISILGNTDIATLQSVKSGIEVNDFKKLGTNLIQTPKNFHLNSKIARQFEAKKIMIETGENIDWSMGEALAFASILKNGFNIRFTGEDVERGTFSHRHAALTDQENDSKHIPLNSLDTQGKIFISNSLLSEFGVLAYEYGYAISNAKTLTIWEAQFGDFANGAQTIIDQYISSAESKWALLNNLVVLLPHGYEGQGPEHSSARLERFLQLCAQNNLQVCNCTTPASIFHLLRRQILQPSQKPLIIMTPKSLLRHKMAISKLEDIAMNTQFLPIIPDTEIPNPAKIIFCSGKVYYDLIEHREKMQRNDIAIVRIEQLYPFPTAQVQSMLNANKNAQIIWCQEEPENMGGFSFVKPIFNDILNRQIEYVGRKRSASPAVGFMTLHAAELEEFLKEAMR